MRYSFADCVLDIERHEFTRGGERVSLEPQVFDLLRLLAERAPDLVSYDAMLDAVWHGRIVSDATIASRVATARTAVGDSGKQQAVIRTVARRGVQFVVPVTAGADSDGGAPPPPSVPLPSRELRIGFATSADGTAIAYATAGEGTALVKGGHWLGHLEHDWVSPVFGPLLRRLSAAHTLVRYDPRGAGLSERNPGRLDVDALTDDLAAVADAARLARFPMLAVSQNVPIALNFAARHPDRVSALVLIGGFAQGSDLRGEAGHTETMVQLIRSGWGDADSPFMRAFATLFVPGGTSDELSSFAETQRRATHPELAARLRRAIGGFDVTEILPAVAAPTLVIHGARDAVHPAAQGQLIASRVPNAEFRGRDTADHVLLPSAPDWEPVVGWCERFIAENSG